ncbi:hypothetical protein CPB97_010493 [Podila verticillata]|nr:hypothetical protein CPB97_010493 [Podila verticillata]
MSALASHSIHNILVLGEVISGKSTLIEALKKYADPNYTVNKRDIGEGAFTCTKTVSFAHIQTNNPEYFITPLKTKKRVDYSEFITEFDQEDYESKLNDRRYLLERNEPNSPKVAFNLIDTPGLNDISISDEGNLAIILKALSCIDSINLVAITVSDNPFTDGLMGALKAYVGLWPEFNGNIVFVHTKIDYAKLHPEDDSQFAQALLQKKKILAQLVGRDSVPHLLIDNNIGTKQVVRDCITQNTLRNLLNMAKHNQPIPFRIMRMNKTEKMRHVDLILRDKFEAIVKARSEELSTKDKEQQRAMEQISELKVQISGTEALLKNATEHPNANCNEALELLHEELYQQDFSILNMMEESIPMYYPGKKSTAQPGFVHHRPDLLDIGSRNIKVPQQAIWAAKSRRKRN